MIKSLLLILLLVIAMIGCDGQTYRLDTNTVFFSAQGSGEHSTVAGNLMATAIKDANDLDMVFYPNDFVKGIEPGIVSTHMPQEDRDQLVDQFPTGVKDQFLVGTMRGRDIRRFVLQRVEEKYEAELEVAGLRYRYRFEGGYLTDAHITRQKGFELVDDRMYRIAFSNYFFFSGQSFPGYRFRNSLGFTFRPTAKIISARESLRKYLAQTQDFPLLTLKRGMVTKTIRGNAGALSIPQIQGAQHRSPYYAMRVNTTGIVTAIGKLEWYPGGVELYIQDPKEDGDPCTSQAIHVYLAGLPFPIKIGDRLEVHGVVYEQIMGQGLGRTSIRDVTDLKLLGHVGPEQLPKPVLLGKGGLEIPNITVSSYVGDLNLKPYLDPRDGIDFWECLEGMRVQYHNPRIVGFRGGKEQLARDVPRGYLTLYTVADGDGPLQGETPAGGITVDETIGDFNPEIITVGTNHMSRGIDTKLVYNVGDTLTGTVTGVLGYEKNIFGDGEYTLMIPEALDIFARGNGQSYRIRALHLRPKTRIRAEDNELSVATYNLWNLSGNQVDRLRDFGQVIADNLQCPDLINLVELMDNNGTDFFTDASAEITIKRLISFIDCPGKEYEGVNIDPIPHSEGGMPGGNVRIGLLYNKNKLGFNKRQMPHLFAETLIMPDGNLNHNPGRVYPNDEAFHRVRKSLVAQFDFRGENIFVIGNHFNSKLGDDDPFQARQPIFLRSEQRRARMAAKINQFVQILQRQVPDANIIVLGDFNSLILEKPMRVLEGSTLTNIMLTELPANDRYTYNYNGSSQPLDFIFVNDNLINKFPEVDVPHLNSDFMGRMSDHDPVVSKFRF